MRIAYEVTRACEDVERDVTEFSRIDSTYYLRLSTVNGVLSLYFMEGNLMGSNLDLNELDQNNLIFKYDTGNDEVLYLSPILNRRDTNRINILLNYYISKNQIKGNDIETKDNLEQIQNQVNEVLSKVFENKDQTYDFSRYMITNTIYDNTLLVQRYTRDENQKLVLEYNLNSHEIISIDIKGKLENLIFNAIDNAIKGY